MKLLLLLSHATLKHKTVAKTQKKVKVPKKRVYLIENQTKSPASGCPPSDSRRLWRQGALPMGVASRGGGYFEHGIPIKISLFKDFGIFMQMGPPTEF